MFSSQNSQVSGAAADPYFNQTTLLLHGDGTNGAQNNTFLDSSTNNFTITRNGNTTQGTFTPFSQAAGYWGNFFNSTSDYLSLSSNAGAFRTSNFTVEGWVFSTQNQSGSGAYFFCGDTTAFVIGMIGDKVSCGYSLVAYTYTGVISIPNNTWTHISAVRNGSTTYVYVNGVLDGSFSDTRDYNPTISYVGGIANSYNFVGYVSNIRAVNGTAVYTAAFTPSTTPLTAITNTSLLTCQSSRFVDNSTNNFTLTANGNVSVQPFSPFAPTSTYSTAVNGGSGYFDGAGDYLTFPQQTYSSDFTIELWVYQTDASGSYIPIVCSESGAYNFPLILDYNGTGYIGGYFQGGTPFGDTGVKVFEKNTWTHIAVSRSGSSIKYFVNGVLVLTLTGTPTLLVDKIGGYQASSYLLKGYISNLRITNTAVYTAAFTPPTAPLTVISGTSLLTNFTNAGIFDNAMKNDLETVGNAQISTSVVKYGTGSMTFDGTGDWLLNPISVNLAFNTGDFTIEGWVYPTSSPAYACILDTRTGFGNGGFGLFITSGTGLQIFTGSGVTIFTGTSCITINTWQHIAISRSGTNFRVFVNGTQIGSTVTNSNNMSDGSLIVGNALAADRNYPYTGYIDDIRITKGVARYTAAFISPTAAFSNQ